MIEPIYNREYFLNRTEDLKNQHIKDISDLIRFFANPPLCLTLHINYGTLLGAVREHDFIPHDKDIDLTYISAYESTDEVKKEILVIAEVLKNNGMLIKDFNNRGQMHVRVPNGSLVVDIFTSWFENNRYNLVPFGNICSKEIIYPFKSCLLHNDYFQIPNQSNILLNILYKDWRNPISKNENYLKLPKRSDLK